MQIQSLSGWHDHIRDGRRYLKTAGNGLSRPAVFNNELIFQLTAMAIEKLIVGVCQYHRQMPFDHTLTGLVEGLAPVCPIDAELADKIKGIEQIDNMCTLASVRRNAPSDAEIQGILDVGRQVASFARQHVPWDDEASTPDSNREKTDSYQELDGIASIRTCSCQGTTD